jgi:hypothetical protein
MTRFVFALITLLLVSGCEEPFIVFAGGELSGPVAAAPDDWSELSAIDTVQLETQPEDPYSINIWIAGVAEDLYVATGEDGTNWTEHIHANAKVRVRANANVYELEAYLVHDDAERSRVSQAYVGKYDLDEADNWVMKGMIFRLDRR